MLISKPNPMFPTITIEVSGVEGNAYCIVAKIINELKLNNYSDEYIEIVKNDLIKSDYIHLLHVAGNFINISDQTGLYWDEFDIGER